MSVFGHSPFLSVFNEIAMFLSVLALLESKVKPSVSAIIIVFKPGRALVTLGTRNVVTSGLFPLRPTAYTIQYTHVLT